MTAVHLLLNDAEHIRVIVDVILAFRDKDSVVFIFDSNSKWIQTQRRDYLSVNAS